MFGYPEMCVKYILFRVSSGHIKQIISRDSLPNLPLKLFVDKLAKILYPFSTQLKQVENDMTLVKSAISVGEAERQLEKLVARYQKLCTRWDVPNSLTNNKKIDFLLNKLPLYTAQNIVTKDYEHLSYDENISQ